MAPAVQAGRRAACPIFRVRANQNRLEIVRLIGRRIPIVVRYFSFIKLHVSIGTSMGTVEQDTYLAGKRRDHSRCRPCGLVDHAVRLARLSLSVPRYACSRISPQIGRRVA